MSDYALTFDDGIAVFYDYKDTTEPGGIPQIEPVEIERFYYQNRVIGIQRHYSAKAEGTKLSKLIRIWYDDRLGATNVVKLDGKEQLYKVEQIQDVLVDGLKCMDVSLVKDNADEDA